MARRQLGAKAARSDDAATLSDVGTPSGFRGTVRYVSGDLQMAANSETSLSFGSTDYDVGGYTTGISGDTICKVPAGAAGFYKVNIRVIVDNEVNSGGIAVLIRLNGFLYRELPLAVSKGVGAHMVSTADIFELSVNDQFTATYYANTTGMVMRSANGRTTQFILERLN